MTEVIYEPGMLIRHPARPEWGPGKVLQVKGRKLWIHFRDDDQIYRTISTKKLALPLAAEQTDPHLDYLPPFRGDGFESGAKRVGIEALRRSFLRSFPAGFHDPDYLGRVRPDTGEEVGERNYKWRAHERYVELLGEGRAEELLAAGQIDLLTERACRVVSQELNLLSRFEDMAFRDGLSADPIAAQRFFTALLPFIAAEHPRKDLFDALAEAFVGLPAEEGKARVATWPVLTILPFLARPDLFVLVKPEVTKQCAERLPFDIQYSSQLRWLTYERILKMSDYLREKLSDLMPRDYIDVQSLIWVVAKYGS